MGEVARWQGSPVDVQARLVPRFLWTTASIDVFLDGECILRTGGQWKFTGTQSSTFTRAGSTHTAELKWGVGGLSFPCELTIDGVRVAAARVHIENCPIGFLVAAVVLFAVVAAVSWAAILVGALRSW